MKRNNTLSDEQLLSSFSSNDPHLMAELYQRYAKKVYHKCLSFSKDHDKAFDLSQDIMIKAFEKLESFNSQSSFSTWLYAITFNHCVEATRKQKRRPVVPLHPMMDQASEEVDFSERLMWEKLEEQLQDFLAELPEDDRNILLLKYMEKRSVKEIQQRYQLSSSAVKMRLMRARKRVLAMRAHAA